MRIESLKYFIEVAKSSSITKAAETLFLNQTTLSATIRSLEEELNVVLFKRTKKGVSLTSEGEKILPLAQEVIEQYTNMLRIQLGASSEYLYLDVYMYPLACTKYSICLAQKCRELIPNVNLSIVEKHEKEIVKSLLLTSSWRIGIVAVESDRISEFYTTATRKKLVVEQFTEAQPMRIYLSASCKYANHELIDVRELANECIALTPYEFNYYISGGVNKIIPAYTIFNNPYLIFKAVTESNMLTFRDIINEFKDFDSIENMVKRVDIVGLQRIQTPKEMLIYNSEPKNEAEFDILQIMRQLPAIYEKRYNE